MIHDGVSSLLRSSCFFLSVFGLAMAILCYIHFLTCTNPPNPESQIQNSKNRKSKIQTPNCLIGEGKGMQRHAKAPFFIKCPNQHIYIQGFEVPQKCFQTMCCLQNASKCHPNAWPAWLTLFMKCLNSTSQCTSIYFYKMNCQHLLPIKTGHLELFFSIQAYPL